MVDKNNRKRKATDEPEKRGNGKRKAQENRAAKLAKKEARILKAVEKAAKKARDFAIRKLKRRLALLEKGETLKADPDVASGGDKPEEDGTEDKALKRLKFETGTKESITKQLEVAQRAELKLIVKKAAQELGIPHSALPANTLLASEVAAKTPEAAKTSEAEEPAMALPSAAEAMPKKEEAGSHDSSDDGDETDEDDDDDDKSVEGKSEDPLEALDEQSKTFALKILQQKGVKYEMDEGKTIIDTALAEIQKWERLSEKSIRKAAARAARKAEEEKKIQEAIERGETPPPTAKQLREAALAAQPPKPKRRTKEEKNAVKKARKYRKYLAAKAKAPSDPALKKGGKYTKEAKKRLKQAAALANADNPQNPPQGQLNRPKSVKGQLKRPNPAQEPSKTTGGQGTEQLHPSWTAKKKQKVDISQTPQGKKVVFE